MSLTIHLTVSLALFAPQGEVEKPPLPEPAVAAKKIGIAVKEAPAPAIDLLQRYGQIADTKVVREVGRALRHKDTDVQAAALHALRFNEHESVVAELIKHRRNKRLVEHHVLGAEYYLALGQHGDLKALPIIKFNLKSARSRDKVTTARILALGKMRTRASVDTLIDLFRTARGGSRNNVRLSLVALTGEDLGGGWVAWARWWAKARRGFKVDKTEPKMSDRLAKDWGKVWAEKKPVKPAQTAKAGGQDTDDGDPSTRKQDARKNAYKRRRQRGKERRAAKRKDGKGKSGK